MFILQYYTRIAGCQLPGGNLIQLGVNSLPILDERSGLGIFRTPRVIVSGSLADGSGP